MLSITNNQDAKAKAATFIVVKAKIDGVEDISGKAIPYLNKVYDLGIQLHLDIGKDFKPTLIIAGNFKSNEKKEVDGWGSAFVVRDFFSRLGYDGALSGENKITQEMLDHVVGKEFLRLSYLSGIKQPSGKKRYSDWSQIASVKEGEDALVKRFLASVAKGYPSNYHPELAGGEQEVEFPPVQEEL